MYILYTVTLKVAEGLFNQSDAEYICNKSLKKMRPQRYLMRLSYFLRVCGGEEAADLSTNNRAGWNRTFKKVCIGDL